MKNKVRLPKDRTGIPVNIGDVLWWEDGTMMRVAWLTYFGDGDWIAESENGDFTDNIESGVVVNRKKKGR